MTPKSAAPRERARTAFTTMETGVVTNCENTSASVLRATSPPAWAGDPPCGGDESGGFSPPASALDIAAPDFPVQPRSSTTSQGARSGTIRLRWIRIPRWAKEGVRTGISVAGAHRPHPSYTPRSGGFPKNVGNAPTCARCVWVTSREATANQTTRSIAVFPWPKQFYRVYVIRPESRTNKGGRMRARTNCSPLLLLIAGVLGTACNPSYTGSSTTVSVTVTPQQATLAMSATLSFAAAVSGGSSADVLWSVQEVGGGMIDASGKYTAPAVAGTFHVVAASMADPSSTDNATVTVSASGGISVAVIPRNASVVTGGSLPFTATVSGTSGNQSTAVTWSVQESGGGSINASGQYTASGSTGTYLVIATSVADTSKKDTATVSVTSTPVIAVSVSPGAVSTLTGGTIPFTATVTGTTTGQSTAVTWSVQESGGGSVSASGVYTAPSSGGTYHVVATSVADTSKKDTATVTVTAPVITVAVSPQATETTPGGSLSFSAAVGGSTTGQSTAVTWSVQEGSAGGTVTSSGGYTAPATSGTYHVVATSVADPSKSGTATVSVTTLTIIPSDRRTTWNPGLMSVGGVPNRTTICATVQASTYGNGASDATAGIQAAINGCPVGQVVSLSAGTFTINNDIVMINKGVTLRGAGAGSTLLQRTNGATPGSYIPGVAKPVIIVGPARWGSGGSAVNLANDAVKGADSVQLAAAPTGC